MGGSASSILTNHGNIVAATQQPTYVRIRGAIKIPILFLYGDSPEEENRQSEKLHLTLKV
jgi:hypothetical protein